MKASTMLFRVAIATGISLLVACSSSSSSGGGSAPTCQNPAATGPGSPACNSCLQSSCGSQLSSATAACGAYDSCFSACQCSSLTCLVGCTSKIDSTCMGSYMPLTTCLNQNCMSQCTTVVSLDGGTE